MGPLAVALPASMKKQAEGLTVSVLDMVNAYCNLKDSCDFRCFWEKISLFMRMVATATNCNVRVVTRNWINCMDNLDEKTKIAMEDAICKEDFHALLALQLPHEILLKCIGNFMEKLFRSHGYDCGEMIDNLLLSLCGAWVDPTNILSTLMHVCGFPLGVVMQNVNGVMCLVKGAVFAKIGNLLNIPYAIKSSC
ncbi:uncharacterized protein PAF06_011563 [Gastrophryne carolinensis]